MACCWNSKPGFAQGLEYSNSLATLLKAEAIWTPGYYDYSAIPVGLAAIGYGLTAADAAAAAAASGVPLGVLTSSIIQQLGENMMQRLLLPSSTGDLWNAWKRFTSGLSAVVLIQGGSRFSVGNKQHTVLADNLVTHEGHQAGTVVTVNQLLSAMTTKVYHEQQKRAAANQQLAVKDSFTLSAEQRKQLDLQLLKVGDSSSDSSRVALRIETGSFVKVLFATGERSHRVDNIRLGDLSWEQTEAGEEYLDVSFRTLSKEDPAGHKPVMRAPDLLLCPVAWTGLQLLTQHGSTSVRGQQFAALLQQEFVRIQQYPELPSMLISNEAAVWTTSMDSRRDFLKGQLLLPIGIVLKNPFHSNRGAAVQTYAEADGDAFGQLLVGCWGGIASGNLSKYTLDKTARPLVPQARKLAGWTTQHGEFQGSSCDYSLGVTGKGSGDLQVPAELLQQVPFWQVLQQLYADVSNMRQAELVRISAGLVKKRQMQRVFTDAQLSQMQRLMGVITVIQQLVKVGMQLAAVLQHADRAALAPLGFLAGAGAAIMGYRAWQQKLSSVMTAVLGKLGRKPLLDLDTGSSTVGVMLRPALTGAYFETQAAVRSVVRSSSGEGRYEITQSIGAGCRQSLQQGWLEYCSGPEAADRFLEASTAEQLAARSSSSSKETLPVYNTHQLFRRMYAWVAAGVDSSVVLQVYANAGDSMSVSGKALARVAGREAAGKPGGAVLEGSRNKTTHQQVRDRLEAVEQQLRVLAVPVRPAADQLISRVGSWGSGQGLLQQVRAAFVSHGLGVQQQGDNGVAAAAAAGRTSLEADADSGMFSGGDGGDALGAAHEEVVIPDSQPEDEFFGLVVPDSEGEDDEGGLGGEGEGEGGVCCDVFGSKRRRVA